MAKLKLGEFCVERKLITEEQLLVAIEYQQRWNKKFGKCLIDLGYISEKSLYETLAKSLKLPIIDLSRIKPTSISREILQTIPTKVAQKNKIVPLSMQDVQNKKRLIVATCDPLNYDALKEVRFSSPLPLFVMIAPESDIEWFMQRYYSKAPQQKNYVSVVQIKKIGQDDKNLKIIEDIFDDSLFDSNTKVYRPKKD